MGQGKQMKTLIYRPDKADNQNVIEELLYYPNGDKYKRPTPQQPQHPLEKITKIKIKSSFVEVDR